MLELVLNANRDVRRKAMMDTIREMQAQGISKIYVLTPEQSTYVMDKECCSELGNSFSNQYIQVVGFKRLARLVYAQCGGYEQLMVDGARLLAMTAAVDKVIKELDFYKASARRPDFLEMLLSTYTTMKMHGVTLAMLAEAAKQMHEKEPGLGGKLSDLSKIYMEYEKLCADGTKDATEELTHLNDILDERDFLTSTAWFVDGFTDFPMQQFELLSTIIKKSAYVMLTLPADGMNDASPAHQIPVQTAEMLCKKFDAEIADSQEETKVHPALAALQKALCSGEVVKNLAIPGAEKHIKLFCDPSPYQECQHIAGTIMKAIRNGYRYRDISIVLCEFDKYAPILSTVCRRYGIPIYLDSQKDEIAKKPIMLAVFAALDSATRGMQTEHVLQYIKSGMCNLTTEECDTLETYARVWLIHGSGWEPDESTGWTGHPDGYGHEFRGDDADRLKAINEYRVRGLGPLIQLKDALKKDATVADYITALYNFLEEIHLTEHLQEIVDELMDTDRDQLAMEYSQVSSVLNTAMEQMYGSIGHLEKSQGDFVKLFKLLCKAYKIATVPVSVDQIEVFSIGDARYTDSKLRYIAGAEEGSFPAYIQASSLLSPDEILALRAFQISLPGTSDDLVYRSLCDIDNVIHGAQKMLVLSYASDPAAPTTPSHLLLRIKNMFASPNNVDFERGCGENGIYDADLLSTEMAGRLLGRISRQHKYEDIALSLSTVDALQNTAMRVMDKADWTLNDLSKQSIKGLYGNVINLSATRTDTYSSCRYHYFLKYGLALREPPRGKLSSPLFGKFTHFVLEGTAREVENEHSGFQNVSREEVSAIAQKYIEEYKNTQMKGLDSQPERFQAMFKRNCREVMSILTSLHDEMCASDFHGTDFELRIGGENAQLPSIKIKGDELDGTYTGIIDRVDVCEVNGKAYFRVMDYKTGRSKTFDMGDFLCGLSMQLPLYQSALQKLGYDNRSESAGMLYVPAKDPIVASDTKMDDDEVSAEHKKMQQRRGILLNDKAVLNAMEHVNEDGKGRYIPVKYSKDGNPTGDLATAEQLDTLSEYTDLVMKEIVDGIASGNVQGNPISRGLDRNACTYCPMKAACHKDICNFHMRYRKALKTDELWAALKKKVHGDSEDGETA